MKKLAKLLTLLLVVAIFAALLVACVPSDYDKARTNLEEEGYTVYVQDVDDYKLALAIVGIDLDGCEGKVLTAQDDDDFIIMFYLEDNESAENVYNDLSNLSNSLKKLYDVDDGAIVCGQSGKVAYWGTDDAFDDCK